MKHQLWILLCCTVTLSCPLTAQVAAVKISVSVPAGTDPGAAVYVAGTFNGWKQTDSLYRLTRASDGTFRITLPLFANVRYEYKYMLASWKGVETDTGNADISNRILKSADGLEVTDTVASWKKAVRTVPSAQATRMNAMKDSVVASLAPRLSRALDLLKSYVQNELRPQPSAHLRKKIYRRARKNLDAVFQGISKLLGDMIASLSPRQKTSLRTLLQLPAASKDFLNTFQEGLQSVTRQEDPR